MQYSILTHNGTITMTNPATGQHRTVKISTANSGRYKGKRVVSLLIRPEMYRPFGFVNTNGTIWVFQCYAKVKDQLSFHQKLAKMLENTAPYEAKGVQYQFAIKCRRCNRELTDPESITLGIGPTCRGGR